MHVQVQGGKQPSQQVCLPAVQSSKHSGTQQGRCVPHIRCSAAQTSNTHIGMASLPFEAIPVHVVASTGDHHHHHRHHHIQPHRAGRLAWPRPSRLVRLLLPPLQRWQLPEHGAQAAGGAHQPAVRLCHAHVHHAVGGRREGCAAVDATFPLLLLPRCLITTSLAACTRAGGVHGRPRCSGPRGGGPGLHA